MIISFENAMGIHPQMAQLRLAQVAVNAGNLINAETPGYHRKSFDIHLQENLLALSVTHPGHIANLKHGYSENSINTRQSPQHDPVSPAYEQAELTRNLVGLSTTIQFMKARLSTLGLVIQGGQR